MREAEVQFTRRLLQRYDEQAKVIIVDGKVYQARRPTPGHVLREGGVGDVAADPVPERFGEERQDGGRHFAEAGMAQPRPKFIRFDEMSRNVIDPLLWQFADPMLNNSVNRTVVAVESEQNQTLGLDERSCIGLKARARLADVVCAASVPLRQTAPR